MRIALITLQAAVLTLIVVIGAQGEAQDSKPCPLPQPQASQSCH